MKSSANLKSLPGSEKILFAGHLATAVGFLLISIGTSLRLLESGKLLGGFPFTPHSNSPELRGRDENNVRNYFS